MIRVAKPADHGRIMEIYEIAKAFMRKNGNHTQWQNGYPFPDLVMEDINNGDMYVVCDGDGQVCACFGIFEGDDPTYGYIEGSWGDDTPYAAIHRVASDGTVKGIFRQAFEYASGRYSHLRIDTHEDNITMQKAVTACCFVYRGIIYVEDGTPRRAYEWVRKQA